MLGCAKLACFRFILDNLVKINGGHNAHWRPIWHQCPVCSVNFSVYARMENMEEDIKYFKLLANVEDKKSNLSPVNTVSRKVDAKEFWSQVDMKYINMLAEPFAYKYDFEMFGYSLQEYIDKIGFK